jgi:hypothetical protein
MCYFWACGNNTICAVPKYKKNWPRAGGRESSRELTESGGGRVSETARRTGAVGDGRARDGRQRRSDGRQRRTSDGPAGEEEGERRRREREEGRGGGGREKSLAAMGWQRRAACQRRSGFLCFSLAVSASWGGSGEEEGWAYIHRGHRSRFMPSTETVDPSVPVDGINQDQ